MVLPSRPTVIYAALLVFAVALLSQAAKLQIIEGERWTEKARALHFDNDTVPAPRGPILDASGNVLVDSHELVHLDIAPKEIRDRQKVASLLRAAHVAPAPLGVAQGLSGDLPRPLQRHAAGVLVGLGVLAVGFVTITGAAFESSRIEGLIRGAIEAVGLLLGVAALGRVLGLRR